MFKDYTGSRYLVKGTEGRTFKAKCPCCGLISTTVGVGWESVQCNCGAYQFWVCDFCGYRDHKNSECRKTVSGICRRDNFLAIPRTDLLGACPLSSLEES